METPVSGATVSSGPGRAEQVAGVFRKQVVHAFQVSGSRFSEF